MNEEQQRLMDEYFKYFFFMLDHPLSYKRSVKHAARRHMNGLLKQYIDADDRWRDTATPVGSAERAQDASNA